MRTYRLKAVSSEPSVLSAWIRSRKRDVASMERKRLEARSRLHVGVDERDHEPSATASTAEAVAAARGSEERQAECRSGNEERAERAHHRPIMRTRLSEKLPMVVSMHERILHSSPASWHAAMGVLHAASDPEPRRSASCGTARPRRDSL